jgi:hypothetical protein
MSVCACRIRGSLLFAQCAPFAFLKPKNRKTGAMLPVERLWLLLFGLESLQLRLFALVVLIAWR